MAQQDPFYLIKQELADSVTGLQQKMSRFHGLTSANPERKTLATAVQAGCDDIAWQVRGVLNIHAICLGERDSWHCLSCQQASPTADLRQSH